jgi:hypothetical protein
VRINAICPDCLSATRVDLEGSPSEAVCACGKRRPVNASVSLRERNTVDVCALCGSGYFYAEKDVNGWIGLALILFAVGGFLWGIRFNWFVGMGFLAGASIVDFIAYRLLPDRAICYSCLASYHGTRRNPSHGGYDLGIAGRFASDYEEQRGKKR